MRRVQDDGGGAGDVPRQKRLPAEVAPGRPGGGGHRQRTRGKRRRRCRPRRRRRARAPRAAGRWCRSRRRARSPWPNGGAGRAGRPEPPPRWRLSPSRVACRKAPGGGTTATPPSRCETGPRWQTGSGRAGPTSGCQQMRGMACRSANSARMPRSRACNGASVQSRRSGPLSSRLIFAEPARRSPCSRFSAEGSASTSCSRAGCRTEHTVIGTIILGAATVQADRGPAGSTADGEVDAAPCGRRALRAADVGAAA